MIDTNYSDQLRWAAKAEQVLSKPANEISNEDAKVVTSREVDHRFPYGLNVVLKLPDSCI